MGGGRIPAALQAIFMASNRGEEVHEAPKEADKVYAAPGGKPNARIPFSLQAVFMASNQGQEVHVPPADRTAVKVYRRIWRPRQRTQVSPWACLPPSYTDTNPQDFLDERLEERGYLPLSFDAKETAYYNKPTKHQLASYGQRMIDAVKGYDVVNYKRMISAGLSANACNAHGESLLHMVCRRGNMPLFQILLDAGVDLQQTDDYGRTPMHDCCWSASPSFEIARTLLKKDSTFLFLQDVRGALPLSYVTKSNWGGWNKFLEHVLDEFFPEDKTNKDAIPELCLRNPNSRPVQDPKHCIPASLANMVATGTMHPYEVMLAMTASDDDVTEVSTLFDSDEDDSDSDDSIDDEEVEEDAEEEGEDGDNEDEVETNFVESECEAMNNTDTDGDLTDGGEYTDTDGEYTTDDGGDDTSSSYDDIDVDDIVNYVESLRFER